MRFFYLSVLLLLVSCVSKRLVEIERIDLNEEKGSAIGLPIYSTTRHLYPVFKDNVFIVTIDDKNVRIEKKGNSYFFTCYGKTDTISGKLKHLPLEFIDYTKDINIETFIDGRILIYGVKRFYRVGDWYFDGYSGREIISYDVSIQKLKENRFK